MKKTFHGVVKECFLCVSPYAQGSIVFILHPRHSIHCSDIHYHLFWLRMMLCKLDPISVQEIIATLSTALHCFENYCSPSPRQQRNTSESAGGLDTATLRSIMPYLCLRVLCYILGACSRVKINAVNTPLWMNKFPPRRHCSAAHR